MKNIIHNDTIQIEITNSCINQCGNCTRFVGHHKKPFFMDLRYFKKAVDSLVDFPKATGFPGAHFVGVMGGEPLLHPDFEEMCEYLHSKVEPARAGLWTCFPDGYESYREVIVKTFGNIFLNDHTRSDVMHSPILVSSGEVKMEEWHKWYMIDNCWMQHSWSASINPYGAYFCEIAASLAILLGKEYSSTGKKIAWDIEPGWWTRTQRLYHDQVKEFCHLCGGALPLGKRCSIDEIDDVSPGMLELLKDTSPKVKAGKYKVHDMQPHHDDRAMASYKDENYRNKIAERYGIFLMGNELCFQTPYLSKKWKGKEVK